MQVLIIKNMKKKEVFLLIFSRIKIALCLEIEENYSKAIELYEMVYKNYPSSKDALRAEKYAESLKLGKPVYKFDMSISE